MVVRIEAAKRCDLAVIANLDRSLVRRKLTARLDVSVFSDHYGPCISGLDNRSTPEVYVLSQLDRTAIAVLKNHNVVIDVYSATEPEIRMMDCGAWRDIAILAPSRQIQSCIKRRGA
jgi:hypothetical protein